MANPTLSKNYTAETAVKKNRIVAFGTAEGSVIHATAATDKAIGVSLELDAAAGERVDVVRTGIADVEYGGTVAVGDLLTSDSDGCAVVAAPAAGENARVVGVAEHAGLAGDIGAVLISCGSLQG